MCCSPKPCFCAQPQTSHRGAPAEKPPNPSPPLELQLHSARCPGRFCSWHLGAGLAWPLSPLEDLLQQGVPLTSRERPAHQEGRRLLTGMFTPSLETRRDARAPGEAVYLTQVQRPESPVLATSLARESE